MAKCGLLCVVSMLMLLSGCAIHETHSDRMDRGGVERDPGTSYGVPRNARVVDETHGGRLDYAVAQDGKVYLADDTARTVIWDGRVHRGDRVYVNPDKNRIELNGKKQADIDLKSNHRFVLFFAR
jgi:hypothetical protein